MRPPALLVSLISSLCLGAVGALGDTRPPVDIPGLREAQDHDRAIAALDVQMKLGEWEAARAAASALLERSKTSWHGSLQRALVRLAIAEAKLGRDEEARWHLQALQAMGGGSLAGPLLEQLGPAGDKLKGMPVRAYDEIPVGVEGLGARPQLTPARRTGGEVPPGNAGCTGARGPLWARLQAVIDAQGHLSQPAIVGTSVCYSFEILKAARSWTFEPARRDGVAVAGMYAESINPPALRPFRDLAAGGAAVPEIVTLLEAERYSAAEKRVEQLWNATLDAGSPSRPFTVTLMALRAISLAAHSDPGDQSRATCLWEAAQGEEPAFYHLELAPFGRAGKLLARHRYGDVRSGGRGTARDDAPPGERIERPEILPETRRSPRARFPASSYGASRVYIESTIDEQGAVREPILFDREPGLLGLDLEALDAVCSWRFKPAQLAGKPVGVVYVLTMSVGAGSGAKPPK